MIDVHLIAHTHWDREWYRTREQYRLRLADLVDRVLDRMDREPAFAWFHLDGQTVVLEDYLEVRPEQEGRLRARIAEGRLLVGPWYVMPDMHLVSGESLVRNLALGHRIARGFGRVMAAGYLPDPFGHVAQMPQILAGFGLDSAILWRGFGGPRAEYVWEAPDGTRVMLLHLPREGYCNALRLPLTPDTERPAAAACAIEVEAARSSLGLALLMAGVDHVEPAPELTALAAEIGSLREVRGGLSTLPAYVDAARAAHRERPHALEVVRGELRGGEDYAPLLPGVLSARTYLKQANARVQNLLERRAEPAAALAWRAGARWPQGELAYAWRTLLQNHPHDSICGCSVDAVHDECMTRFARAEQAARGIEERALEHLAGLVPPPPPGTFRFLALNTDLHPWEGVLEGQVDVPLASAEPERRLDLGLLERPVAFFGPDARPAALRDADGRSIPFQVLGFEDRIAHYMSRYEPPLASHVRRFRIAFPARVPGLGFASFDLGFATAEAPTGDATPVVTEGGARAGVSDGRAWLENEHWRIDVNREGTLDVRDRRTGVDWTGLAALVDEGDVGDEYNHAPPAADTVVTNAAGAVGAAARADAAAARVEQAGPLVAAVRVDLTLRIPEAVRADRQARSVAEVHLPVTLRVALTSGSARIDFEVSLTNGARDHRLRVLFPIGTERVDAARADSAFGVVSRPARREATAGFQVEAPVSAAPLHTFVDAGDDGRGLTLFVDGLNEYEVTGEAPPRLALTLLRSVGWLSRDDLSTRRGNAGPSLETPGAQCLGPQRFRFAARPRVGPADDASLYKDARAFLAPPRLAGPAGREGALGPSHSFLEAGGGVVLSALKRADDRDALVLRVFNPGRGTARLTLERDSDAFACDLGERRLGTLSASDGRVEVPLTPHQVKTVELP
jgi:mannosylglycerate hydrolase